MNILAFDTTMGACSAALLKLADSERQIFCKYHERDRGHAETIMPMIVDVMGQAGLKFHDLHRIAVTLGPGTFTGVRIGIAVARGLALASGVGVVGCTSLQVMAASIFQSQEKSQNGVPLAIAVDARRGQVYFQLFDHYGGELTEPMVVSPKDALRFLPKESEIAAAGTGAPLLAEALGTSRSIMVINNRLQPDAAVLADLAVHLPLEEIPVSPFYLRTPDAKPQSHKVIPKSSEL